MLIDMHMHTNYSDGVYPLKQVVEMAANRGIRTMAVTDHDTIAGTSQALALSGQGLKIISGLEVTCKEQKFGRSSKCSVHLLGYGYNPEFTDLEKRFKRRDRQIRRLFQELIGELAEFGMFFSYEQVAISCGTLMQLSDISRHVVLCFSNSIYLKKAEEKIQSYTGKITAENLDFQEAVELIHQAGGVTVWAHPCFVYENLRKTEITCEEAEQMVSMMKPMGLDGMEAWYLDFSAARRLTLASIARRNTLFLSGGSDFHGLTGREGMGVEVGERELTIPGGIL